MSMDALSEILRVIKLDSAIFFNAEFSEPWCLASPESRTLAPVLARGAGHVIIYHLLCEGRAYAQLEDGERVALSAGDLVTFPHGHGHVLGAVLAFPQSMPAPPCLACSNGAWNCCALAVAAHPSGSSVASSPAIRSSVRPSSAACHRSSKSTSATIRRGNGWRTP
jgi:hypothetical protein